MSFIDSYKHLEKLCGEIFNDSRRLSAYIDEMINTEDGDFYVQNWNNDLKKLKHYRWIRNQIAHEPGCNEENMCEREDELWLNNFHTRIMNQTDPLSLYRKARFKKSKPNSYSAPSPKHEPKTYTTNNQPDKKHPYLEITLWVIMVIILFFLFLKK